MGRLFASNITNNTNTDTIVTAIYKSEDDHYEEEVTHIIPRYKSHTFGPKTKGSAKLRLSRLDISDNNKRTRIFNEPFVMKDKEKVDYYLSIPFEELELHQAEGGHRHHVDNHPMPHVTKTGI
ncbi:predicted protein [Naegleria gruberi]|uniref:Predicted protein n=1 Tax=Naegleria gruberi TaxID=5762 RepID=D2VT04_NAEGR|nr:uncharacterized protein NAEGRDRAFT_52017 [Naegleria gruberi]EFC40065.1 predicted protein [Naegleria gruberi]|eukprot:XP_002672809.1 predicted protein [Naegleria gruberi strain NEG-M]